MRSWLLLVRQWVATAVDFRCPVTHARSLLNGIAHPHSSQLVSGHVTGFQARHQAALERFNLEAASESSDGSEDDHSAAEGSDNEAEGVWLATTDDRPSGAAQPCSDVPAVSAQLPSPHDDLQACSPTEETAGHLASACRLDSDSDALSEDASTSASDRAAEAASVAESAPQGQPRAQDCVRRRVTEQRQNAARRGALAHASRNAQKAVSRKGRNDVNASRLLG